MSQGLRQGEQKCFDVVLNTCILHVLGYLDELMPCRRQVARTFGAECDLFSPYGICGQASILKDKSRMGKTFRQILNFLPQRCVAGDSEPNYFLTPTADFCGSDATHFCIRNLRSLKKLSKWLSNLEVRKKNSKFLDTLKKVLGD